MANLPISVLRFAVDHGDGMKELVDNFVDFYNQHRAEQWGHKTQFITEYKGQKISFAEKERAIDGMILREMGKMAGVDVTSMKAEQMMSHPVVKWAAVNIVSQLIDAVLPDTMVQGTGAYAEVISRDLGETYVADIKSRDLFAVTKSGRGVGQRHAEIHRALTRQVVINPEGHQITVGVNLFRVLTGQESLAEFTTKAMRSMETEVTKDIYFIRLSTSVWVHGDSLLIKDARNSIEQRVSIQLLTFSRASLAFRRITIHKVNKYFTTNQSFAQSARHSILR